MAGHSKWATTKHRKAAQDKKRGALFSKLSRAITTAAKTGGSPDPENNAALAAAIAKAKSYSLPKDRIEAAIQKASGPSEGEDYAEVVYEGYAPHGIAVYALALTDNRNRTAADVRSAFTRGGGNLASTGSVAFQFERKGEISVAKEAAPGEEELLLAAMDAGAEDMDDDGPVYTLVTDAADMMAVRDAVEAADIRVKGVELVMRPSSTVELDVGDARQVLRLVEALEDLEDVQDVYHNLELTDELMAALDAE
jgi:YebC/PmpR family DNA-binding regulatory protein